MVLWYESKNRTYSESLRLFSDFFGAGGVSVFVSVLGLLSTFVESFEVGDELLFL